MNETKPTDRLAGLDALIAGTDQGLPSNIDPDAQIRVDRAKTEDAVRSFVTKSVLITYLAMLAILLLAHVLAATFSSKAPTFLPDGLDLILKGGSPIAALVLGYYFGSATR